jgi:hypothetical protein
MWLSCGGNLAADAVPHAEAVAVVVVRGALSHLMLHEEHAGAYLKEPVPTELCDNVLHSNSNRQTTMAEALA